MLKKSIKSIISIVVCLSFLFTSVGLVFAASNGQEAQRQAIVKEQTAQALRINNAKKIMTRYVKRLSDGTFQINVPENVKKQIDSEDFTRLTQGMELINSYI
ncbi:hypothetical protein, partial [Desulfosporosinus sp. OT]|uniref:hypothetical protein n=1 Tax=Desulfosporosinus sp. OT TaxID=913865 RepID=UPI000223AA4E